MVVETVYRGILLPSYSLGAMSDAVVIITGDERTQDGGCDGCGGDIATPISLYVVKIGGTAGGFRLDGDDRVTGHVSSMPPPSRRCNECRKWFRDRTQLQESKEED